MSKGLLKQGVVVIDLFTQEQVNNYSDDIQEDLKGNPFTVQYILPKVGGSFGAFRDPYSFHSLEVREVRQQIVDQLVEQNFIYNFGRRTDLKYSEVLYDSFRLQPTGTKSGGETWHRDVAKTGKQGDIILGGWLNMSNGVIQKFICVPKSHTDKSGKRGFVKQKKPKKFSVFEVKPGQIILFYQNILHKVASTTIKNNPSVRLHFGLRFTNFTESLHGDEKLEKVFTNFISPPLPSGQAAAMWPKLYRVNWPKKLLELTELYRPEFYETIKLKGRERRVLSRFLEPKAVWGTYNSYEEQNFYEYSEEEKNFYRPRKIRKLRK